MALKTDAINYRHWDEGGKRIVQRRRFYREIKDWLAIYFVIIKEAIPMAGRIFLLILEPHEPSGKMKSIFLSANPAMHKEFRCYAFLLRGPSSKLKVPFALMSWFAAQPIFCREYQFLFFYNNIATVISFFRWTCAQFDIAIVQGNEMWCNVM